LAIFGMKHVKQDVLENTFFEPLAARWENTFPCVRFKCQMHPTFYRKK
jgi:hypothetical protein